MMLKFWGVKMKYKNFEIEIIKSQHRINFIDKDKFLKCFYLKIKYPRYRYNVMINHIYINLLEEYLFYHKKNIKDIVKKGIDLFLEQNKEHFFEVLK